MTGTRTIYRPFFRSIARKLELIHEAKSWLHTPFRDHCGQKGLGADCGLLRRCWIGLCCLILARKAKHGFPLVLAVGRHNKATSKAALLGACQHHDGRLVSNPSHYSQHASVRRSHLVDRHNAKRRGALKFYLLSAFRQTAQAIEFQLDELLDRLRGVDAKIKLVNLSLFLSQIRRSQVQFLNG